MARNGVTYDQVAEAAKELRQMGMEPSMTTVRERLGAGSFTTISAHLAKWKSEQAKKPITKPIPSEVENAAIAAINTIWHIANDQATMEVQRIEEEREELKNEMKKQIDERNKIIETLENHLEKQENDLAELLKRIKEHELAEAKQRGRIEQLESLNSSLINQIKQLEQDQAKLADKKVAPKKQTKAES